jgi:hypothetical protein
VTISSAREQRDAELAARRAAKDRVVAELRKLEDRNRTAAKSMKERGLDVGSKCASATASAYANAIYILQSQKGL